MSASIPPAAGPARRRSFRPRGPHGPRLRMLGSVDARLRAAAILEVLAGARTPAQAADAVHWSLPRYYAAEARALEGFVRACEPKRPGRVRPVERELGELRRRCLRLEREVGRYQALLRVAHRSVGLAPPPTPGKGVAGSKRRRRPQARALPAAARLRRPDPAPEPTLGTETTETSPAAVGGGGP